MLRVDQVVVGTDDAKSYDSWEKFSKRPQRLGLCGDAVHLSTPFSTLLRTPWLLMIVLSFDRFRHLTYPTDDVQK